MEKSKSALILHHVNRNENRIFESYIQSIALNYNDCIKLNVSELIFNRGINYCEKYILDIVNNYNIKYIYYINPGWDFTLNVIYLNRIKEKGVKICLFNFDTEYYFEGADRYYAQIADYIALTDPISVYEYRIYGFNAHSIGSLFDSKLYKDCKAVRDIDVSFIGNLHVGNREILIKNIKDSGVDIKVFGAGSANGRVSEDQMINIFNRSKIVICPSGHYDKVFVSYRIPYVRKLIYQAKGRPIEAAMCGSLVLAEKTLGIRKLFRIGIEIEQYEDITDAVKIIKKYLNNPEKIIKVATTGKEAALVRYDLHVNMRKVIDNFEKTNSIDRGLYIDRVYYINRASFYLKVVVKLILKLQIINAIKNSKPVIEPQIYMMTSFHEFVKKWINRIMLKFN